MSNPKKDDSKPAPTVRDPNFALFAYAAFYGALLPVTSYTDSDRDQANETAQVLACALDTGELPVGFTAPEYARRIEQAREAERLNSYGQNPHGGKAPGQIFTASQVQKAREAQAKNGAPASEAQVKAEHDTMVKTISTISEPVRFAALHASVGRIGMLRDVTGARKDEALAILVDMVLVAQRRARQLEIQERAIGELADGELANLGTTILPYPASLAGDFAVAIVEAASNAPETTRTESGEASPGVT